MDKTFVYEGNNRIYLGARAVLIENDREIASEWASKHIQQHPAYSWILGKFVEADRANKNQQYFSLDNLRMAQPTINHAPMNMNHSERNIVGAFTATEMIYPTGIEPNEQFQMGAEGDVPGINPYVEALGVFWRYYFADEYKIVQAAHAGGQLFFSMEAVPRALSTVGGADDATEYPYEGVKSSTYPDEINDRKVPINLIDPTFVGGALIIPPVRPGWGEANVSQVAKFFEQECEKAEAMYNSIKEAAPDLTPRFWEAMMAELITQYADDEIARNFNEKQRKDAAKNGDAMPDGSFPIKNVGDLKNAIRLAGQAKDPAEAKAHIKKRAAALGATNLIPSDWK